AGGVDVEGTRAIGRVVHDLLDEGVAVRMLVDASELRIYSPEAAEVLLGFMKKANPKLERAAFLIPTSRTAALQLARLVREAGGSKRRIFADREEAVGWLRG